MIPIDINVTFFVENPLFLDRTRCNSAYVLRMAPNFK